MGIFSSDLPTLISSSLASFVEMVEALTIVLAVGAVRGWKSAVVGTISAIFALALIIALGGPALKHADLRPLQLVVGVLLVLFGMRWLKKAILRSAGVIPMHDEEKIYNDEVGLLNKQQATMQFGVDMPAALTAFNGVLIEGIEVVFIVVAVGTTARRLDSAITGAGIALLAVVFLGLALRTPLSKIPENSLKMIVGVMLISLGTLWSGESIGVIWPLGDWAVFGLVSAYAVVAAALIAIVKSKCILSIDAKQLD